MEGGKLGHCSEAPQGDSEMEVYGKGIRDGKDTIPKRNQGYICNSRRGEAGSGGCWELLRLFMIAAAYGSTG